MKSFLSPKFIEHEVGEETLKFYPASLQVAFQVKDILKPLVAGISQILTDTSGDKGHTSTSSKEDGYEQIIVNPTSVDMARWRSQEKEKAILNFLDAFTEKRTVTIIHRVVMDSLRDEFPRRVEQKDVDDFADNIDAESFVQLLTGVVRANKGVFGPFGQMLGESMKGLTQRLQGTVLHTVPEETKTETKSQPDPESTIGQVSVPSSTSSSVEDTPTANS